MRIKIITVKNQIFEVLLKKKYRIKTIMDWVNRNYPNAKEIIVNGRVVEVYEIEVGRKINPSDVIDDN